MDIAGSVSDVVTIIKPKLDQNISQTQEDLNSVTEHLSKSLVEILELTLENGKILENLNKTKTTLDAKNNEYIQTRKELISVKKQFRDSLGEISGLKLENEKVLEKLNKTKATLDAKHNEYIALRSFVTQNPSGAILVLNKLLTMSPSERNLAIRKSTLGAKAINQSGMLPTCVRILRDKAKMSSGCRDRITDFLVVEGW